MRMMWVLNWKAYPCCGWLGFVEAGWENARALGLKGQASVFMFLWVVRLVKDYKYSSDFVKLVFL